MSRFPSSSRARRRGQALLLAVLIMIFAALLSASFLVVVSVNLNQTARQSDKNRAAASAIAGLDYVNRRLTYSAEGERWRGELENVPPAPGDPTYGFYYTPLDLAQGWARTTPHPITDLNGNGRFFNGTDLSTIDPEDEKLALDAARATGRLEMVKSPDPRVNSESDPQYLSTVQRVSNLPLTDADRNNPNLIGATRITVIGLSADDPTAYNRLVRYKGGYQRSPIAQVMRTVSNWDFKNNGVPVAQVATYDATALTISFKSAKDSFINLAKPLHLIAPTVPAQPFTITLSNPTTNVAARSVVVRDIALTATATDPPTYTLTLASAVPAPAPLAGERIELAANLGAPAGINYSNSATPTPVPVAVNISDTNRDLDATMTPGLNQVDSARANGGLIYAGNLNAARLRSVEEALTATNAGTITVPGTVLASGVVAAESTSVATVNAVSNVMPGTPDTLKSSDATGIFASSNIPNQYRVVNDGWNRLRGVPSANGSIRSVSDFRPPNISSGEGLERYRNMARFSAPAAPYTGNAALYGYGQGVYIDNTSDRERVLLTSTPAVTYRDMTQAELVQMWLSKVSQTAPPAATSFMRTDVPTPVADAGSLEQKHLRGWVGPDEFRPRGVEITLGNNTITITRDARDDANPLGASPTQAWKQPDGTVPATDNAIYTRTLPWPTTGVIFAEGNVRIKDNATNAPNSLTVVSMGNIYIEDSLSADDAADGLNTGNPRKILLMARRNVVFNPTRALGRPDVQTLTPATSSQTLTVGTATTLNVVDAASFRRGDLVQASTVTGTTETISAQAIVTADPVSPFTQIAVTPMVSATVAGGSVIRTPLGTSQLVNTSIAGRTVPASAITTGFDAIQRRLFLPSSLVAADYENLRFGFNHQVDRVLGFKAGIKTVTPGSFTAPDNVFFSNKGVLIPAAMAVPYFDVRAATVGQGDKKLRNQFTQPTTGNDDYPGTAPTTEVEAKDTNRILGDGSTTGISAQMNSTTHIDPDPMASPRVGWQYDTSVPATLQGLPFFYLAGVGNRYDFGVAPGGDTRKDIKAAAYDVPLATSIGVTLNAAQNPIFDEHYNVPLSNYDRTRQFGFSPTFLDPTTPPIVTTEDVLTSDQSFYQTDGLKSTLDSRSSYDPATPTLGLAAGNNALVLRQSDNLVQPTAPTTFPTYRLIGAKLEYVDINTTVDPMTMVATTTTATIKPASTFNVNAYVYAQTGSWFVIPGGMFDERLRGTDNQNYLDVNQNGTPDLAAGEFIDVDGSGSWSATDCADLNRNGVVDEAEKFAMTRYSRFNYQINFVGAIAENQTALVNTVYNATNQIVQPGAVDDWMTKWSTTVFPTPASGDPNNRIHYVFDPTILANGLQVTDEGFKLPQTPEMFYQD